MNKSNIDKFFREKFKDFGEVPDEKVWESIEASLEQKQKRRRILPIWWRLGGIAAVLAILFFVVNPFEKPDPSEVTGPELEQVGIPPADKDAGLEKETSLTPDPESEVVQSSSENDKTPNIGSTDEGAVAKTPAARVEQVDRALAKDEAKSNFDNRAIKNQEAQLGVNNPDNNTERADEITQRSTVTPPEDTEVVVTETPEENKNNLENTDEVEAVADLENKEVEEDPRKKSIFDEINQEEEVVAENSENKWSVGPSVAPVYFSSFGEGSPIHSNFIANSKSGNLNLSYGLSVSYDVSKKLSIRSGIHKVDYGYDTNDILFSSSLAASTNNRIDNIDYAFTSKNLVVQSSADSETVQDPSFAASNEIAAPTPSRDGKMVQQFGYLEVPVELNYTLVDRKLGVNIIGGVSSLFLINNSVSLESNGAATEIGEANNINDLNFSTNIGLGINYELSPKLQMNIEPIFKYQLNTFSDTSGNFQPFTVGVYSGLNFKF